MGILTLRGIRKDFGIKEVLKSADFSLEASDRVGLIGTNGSGKSTLLKMLAGLEPFDSGNMEFNNGIRIVYLPQQPEVDEEHTVLEQVFADCGEGMQLVREYESLIVQLETGQGDSDQVMNRLATIQARMDA
jgi:ABC transport system ATP-binding/permease protein